MNKKTLLTIAFIFLVSIAFYLSALALNFLYYDDYAIIKMSLMQPWKYFSGDWSTGIRGHSGLYRPLIIASIGIDRLIWGLNPMGYHLSNLIFHAINAVLVFLIAIGLTGGYLFALMSSLLFIVLPINTEVVNWICCRCDSLATMFYLAAFYSYMDFRKNKRPYMFTACFIAFVLALISKESALSFPIMILLYEYFLGDVKKARKYVPTLFYIFIPYFMVRYFSLGTFFGGYVLSVRDMVINAVLGPIRTIPFVLLPFIQENILLYIVLAPISILLSITGILYYSMKFRPNKVFYFVLCWVFVALIPSLHILSIGFDFRGSRFWYMSAPGIAWVLSYLAFGEAEKYRQRVRVAVYSIFAAFLFYSAYNAVEMNRNWGIASDMTVYLRQAEIMATKSMPKGYQACFYNVPDNYKGCMVGQPLLEPPFYSRDITGKLKGRECRYFVYDASTGSFKEVSHQYIVMHNLTPLYDEMPNIERLRIFMRELKHGKAR